MLYVKISTFGNKRRILRRLSKGKLNCCSNFYYKTDTRKVNIDVHHLFIDFSSSILQRMEKGNMEGNA